MKSTVQLGTLDPGQRFRFPESQKTGAVISQGNMGTRIRFDNDSRSVTIARGEDEVTFDAPGRPTIVSAGADVEVL